MDRIDMTFGGKTALLYRETGAGLPLIVYNAFQEDGSEILAAASRLARSPFHFLCVSNLNWDEELSPWPSPAIYKNEPAFGGGVDLYLEQLTQEILPAARAELPDDPAFTAITGYSLAGLFSVYTLYKTDVFHRAASMSGSLWYPGFLDFCRSHEMKCRPEKLYFSLGDKEARTRNPMLQKVQENTESLAAFYRGQGLNVTWELNPGNHFRDCALRSAKGITALL